MIKFDIRIASASLLALFMAVGTAQVSAQTAAAPAPAAPPVMQAADINDQQLEKFADSLGDIMKIREDFTAKLEKAGDADKARDLQMQANEKMMETVEENKLSIDEYNAINQAVQNDPELRNRVLAMLE